MGGKISDAEIIQNIHVLVGNADNVNSVVADDIENQVRTLRKRIIAFFNIRTVSMIDSPTGGGHNLSQNSPSFRGRVGGFEIMPW